MLQYVLQSDGGDAHETPAEKAALHGMACSSQPEGRSASHEPSSLSRFACGGPRGARLSSKTLRFIIPWFIKNTPIPWQAEMSRDFVVDTLTVCQAECILQVATSLCQPR